MPDHPSPITDRSGTPIEQPVSAPAGNALFGSDVVAETLRALGIPFIALNPGASYRGLHDSLVNHLGNRAPQMLLCLHEEHAVAIAHGYAKVTGRPMAAAVHSNVGLMHATMAHVQRLVRPHAHAGAGRHRPGGRAEAPAVDRLDPHRARPGRAGAALHQVGRPAGLAEAARESLLRGDVAGDHPADGAGLCQSRRRHAGSAAGRTAAADRPGPVRAAAAARRAGPGPAGPGRRPAARGATPGDPVRPRHASARRTGTTASPWPRRCPPAC